jgi:hypothetical protein
LPTHCIMSGLSDCWEMLRVGENTQSHAQRGKALPGFENVCVYIPVMNWLIFHHHLQNKNVKIMDELLHIIDQVNTPASLQKKKKHLHCMIGGGVSGSGFTPSSITISGLNPIGKIKTSRRSVCETGLYLLNLHVWRPLQQYSHY